MLSTAKRLVKKLPGVEAKVQARRLGRPRFERWMDEYIAGHAMTNGAAANGDATLAKLLSDGAVFLPGYFPTEQIKPVHDAFLPMLERVRNGDTPSEWATVDYGEDGIYRLRDPVAYIPESRALFEDEYLRGLVSAYMSGRDAPPALYVDYKPDLKHDYTATLHMDDFKSQVKIFVFLSDIGPGNAPLVYWLKSQRDAPWRREFDYRFWEGTELGTHGFVPITYLRRAREAGGESAPQEVEFCGPAGSVVVGDVRGIHRASVLREGYRLELVAKFIYAS
jgi:hypothetical protein